MSDKTVFWYVPDSTVREENPYDGCTSYNLGYEIEAKTLDEAISLVNGSGIIYEKLYRCIYTTPHIVKSDK